MNIGDSVYYHPRIGGPSDGKRYRIRQLGKLPGGRDVAWLDGKSGCVSVNALSAAELPSPSANVPQRRITVCTFWTPEIECYAKWSTENKRAYAERHGYGFHCPSEARTGRPPSWEKCFVMGEAIDRSEWVWWLDADAIVTNPEIKLESIIDDYFDMIVCHDFNGLNAGSFLLKSGTWAKQFLWDVWRSEQFTHHPWWEQAAMMELLKQERNSLRTKVVEQKILQSYCEWWQPGDFVLHVPGKAHDERLEILTRIDAIARVQREHAAKGGA